MGGWESAQLQWLSEKEQERMRREDPVMALLEDLQLADKDKEEMVYEYIGDTGGLAELALMGDEDLECLMEDMELDGLEMEAFRAAVTELRVEYDVE